MPSVKEDLKTLCDLLQELIDRQRSVWNETKEQEDKTTLHLMGRAMLLLENANVEEA